MSKLYLSFLGTNNYVPCTYYQAGGARQEIRDVRFVQQATIQIYCKDWNSNDRIRIFTTEEAYKKNWVDGGQFSDIGEPLRGLQTCIKELRVRSNVRNVPIPDGKDEQEIWAIFSRLFDEMDDGDKVIFDITHALRSIPLLANVVLNYAKVLKGIVIQGIYYGAFEVLGPVEKVKQMPLEKRRAPIFDLTAFDALHDWSLAIDRFLGSGDAVPTWNLANKGVKPILSESRGKDQAAAQIKRIAKGLRDLSRAISTCWAPEITEIASSLKEEMANCARSDLLPAFRPLLDLVKQ